MKLQNVSIQNIFMLLDSTLLAMFKRKENTNKTKDKSDHPKLSKTRCYNDLIDVGMLCSIIQ